MDDEHARARGTDPETSHIAAAMVDMPKVKRMVYSALVRHGPMHTDEIAAVLGRRLVSVSPALKPLERDGLVVRYPKHRRCDATGALRDVFLPRPWWW